MSQPTLNTTPLFRTSLRNWQAHYKASRAVAPAATAEAPASGPTATSAAAPRRFTRRKRRPRTEAVAAVPA